MSEPARILRTRFAGFLLWIVLLGGCGLTWVALQPPAPLAASAPVTEFSAERAMVHLRAITQKPHPFGSLANQAVKEYILGQLTALGLATEAQTFQNGATGVNVMTRISGARASQSKPTAKAVALVCHYDSTPRGPGASDDGVAVAALLETARALKSGPAPQNDVILLFTDGEERGLLGARAFVTESAWKDGIGCVLNFEARGVSGPVFMFETAPGNARVISEFAKGASHPVANSFMYEVYKRMPNDTDFTVFRRAGIPGLNFAFIGEAKHYHAPTDDLAHVSPRCLQQNGYYALRLARHFGNLDLSQLQGADAVYFDLLGLFVARYPGVLALPLALLAAALFIGVAIFERKRREISIGKLLIGCLVAGVYVVLVGIAFRYVLKAATGLERGAPAWFRRFLDWHYWFMAAGLTVSLGSMLHLILRRWLAAANLAMGAWFWWLAAAIATAVWLPGASYVPLWPLLCVLLGRLAAPREARISWRGFAWLVGMALPVIVLVSPLVWEFHIALGPRAMFVPMVVLALAIGALSLQVEAAYKTWKWGLPLAGFVVALVALIQLNKS